MSGWVRHGECNHCGWCCETIGRFEITAPKGADDLDFLRARGFNFDTLRGPTIEGDFMAPCPMHKEGRCIIYNTRPRTCSEFPSEPNEIKGTPCSYWFERDGQRIGGLGSPYGKAAH